MSCEKYTKLIEDLVEGELGEQSAAPVNLHIFACPECTARYEILKKEKALYARYLFEIEPPQNLWTDFQAKINAPAEVSPAVKPSPSPVFVWKSAITHYARLFPAFAAATLLLAALGFGFLKYVSNQTGAGNRYVSGNNQPNVEIAATKSNRISVDVAKDASAVSKNETRAKFAISKIAEKNAAVKSLNKSESADFGVKRALVKFEKTNKRALDAGKTKVLSNEKKISPNEIRLSEEQARGAQLRNLETETAEQIEKIELLLRSFRNAREVEGGDRFDVAYEKQLAGRLLEKNARLRRGAENYGASDSEEILGKVEPILLDIANLETDAAPEKVLDIKQRLKNQNLIASLQIY